MDNAALRQALTQFENPAGHSFSMAASQLSGLQGDWTAVSALLTAALASDTLYITGIQSFPPPTATAGPIVYAGSATLFPWPTPSPSPQASLAVTASFAVDGAGRPQVVVRATVPGGGAWHLSDSLGGLADTVLSAVAFEAGAFLLPSAQTTDPAYGGPVEPGANFSGTIALTGAYAGMEGLVGPEGARTVSGHVDLEQGDQPTLAMGAAVPLTLTFGSLSLAFGAALGAWYETFSTGSGTAVVREAMSDAAVRTSLRLPGTLVVFSMPLTEDGDPLGLSMVSDPVPLAGWSDLAALTGGSSVAPLLPSDGPAATSLWLTGASLDVAFDDAGVPSLASATVAVALQGLPDPDQPPSEAGWPVLPYGLLTLNELAVEATADLTGLSDPPVSAVLSGRFVFADELYLAASLGLPDLSLTAGLDNGTPASVAGVIEQFMKKITGVSVRPPVDLTLTQFDLAAQVRTGEFQLACSVQTDWSVALGSYGGNPLVTLSFDGLSFQVEYDGRTVSGGVQGYFSINAAEFYFAAGTPGGDDAPWTFGTGLMPGSRIPVLDLLLSFIGVSSGDDYGVPSLAITVLDLSLSIDADNTPFAFGIAGRVDGSWTFTLFGGETAFTMMAAMELAGTRPREDGYVPEDAEWEIAGSVAGEFSLFGLRITAGYAFDPLNTALTFGVWYGNRGLEAAVTRSQVTEGGKQVARTLLTVRLGDLSLGEILEFLVSLAVPGETRRLPSPWDVLYQVDFRDLSLTVDLDSYDVMVDYALKLELGFATFTGIGFLYTSANGEGQVFLRLKGTFLGQSYDPDTGGEPLQWDVIREPAPSVPGKGAGLVDIRYVGMGQHVALPVPDSQLKTVDDVITALKAAMGPVKGGGNPLDDPNAAGLRYDASSRWLFGLDVTLLETLSLAAVFYDPHLYGARIEVAGERGGALAGLRFELVYRRITDDIGEFSVDLRVPDQFRNWEFGEVSVTLGIIHVDVYTNGNFRVDAGFPTGGDFSVSFSVQVFPFIGQGGFYFAYLTGATSERVPIITNGGFDPVIEAGVGLAVGVGKEFQKGPLRAGLALEVYGIFEGVYAPFHPYDATVPQDTYYWFQGTAGIVGKLYGSVDFKVVKASVSVVARAQAVLTLEAHRASIVELHLEVTARASVKVLFVTLHFSFDLTVDASFTLGSTTPTPWIVGTPPPQVQSRASRSLMQGLPAPAPRALRQQRSQAPAATPELAAASHAPSLAAASATLMAEAVTSAAWQPVALYGQGTPKTARFQFVPALTIADPSTLAGGGSGGNQLQIVPLLAAENTIDPHAQTAEEVARVTTDHLHQADEGGTPAFAAVVETFLRWAMLEGAGVQGTEVVYASELAALVELLGDPDFVTATFGYGNLSALLAESLHFEVLNCPSDPAQPSPTSGTFLALIPELTVTVAQGSSTVTRDYTSQSPASQGYATNLAAYFEQLATDYLAAQAADPTAPPAGSPVQARGAEDDPPRDPSLAELVFGEYFALLTQAALQAGADLLAAFPYPYPATNGPSLSAMAAEFATDTVTLGVAGGQTLHGVAMEAGVDPAALEAAYPEGLEEGQTTVEAPVGVTPQSIARDNQGAALAAFGFAAAGLAYQVRAGQSLNAVAAALPMQATTAAGGIPGPLTGAAVGAANAALVGLLRRGATLTIPSFTYTRLPAGESDEFLQAFFRVRNQGAAGIADVDWYAQAIATLNPQPVDWSAWGVATLVVPSAFGNSTTTATYTVHQGDDLARVAATLALYQAGPAGTPKTGTFTVPPMSHAVASTDTFASLVIDFPGLAESALIGANTAADVLTPLVPVQLPAFGVAVPAGQTLAGLAQVFDLTLDELVARVEDVAAIFAETAEDTPLTVRGVPGMEVDTLVAAVAGGDPANQVAAQVSRFLLYGLRVPSPQDTAFTSLDPEEVLAGAFTGSLYGVFDAAGMLFPWTSPATVPATVTLSTTAGWVTLLEAEVHGGGAVDEATARMNPSLAALSAPAPAEGTRRVVATGEAQSISVTLSDAAPWSAWLPSTTLELDATPAPMALTDTSPRHYELQASMHWQAASQPSLDGTPDGDGSPGEPSIWLFPDSLRAVAAEAGTGATPAFALRGRSLSAPPGAEGANLQQWAWAVQVPFTVHRVPAPPPPGSEPGSAAPSTAWLPTTYVVDGADQAGEDLLFGLWTWMQAHSATEAASRVYLLYPPSAVGDAPRGMASDDVPADALYLLKTNLSTETRQPFAVRSVAPEADVEGGSAPPAEVFSAGPDDPVAFVTFLWQATSVQAGGFYLHYEVDGAGLPDFVFDTSGRATLTLLCLLASQTGASPGRGLLAVNNCAVVLDNVDASATQVYAVQTGGAPPMVTTATVPAGNVGFTITRASPEPPAGVTPTAEQLTGMLYNLFGYSVAAGGGFRASNEGLPAGPGRAPDGGTEWYYAQVLEAFRLADEAGRIAQHCAALPSPADDPYAGVSASAQVTVAFAAHDAFGNRAVAGDPPAALPLPFRYVDPLVGVGEWPGAAVSYTVRPGATGADPPRLALALALQAVNYLPAPGVETAVALQAASAHALRWQRVFYQAARPGVAFSATTTLDPASDAMPLALSRARFLGFASAGYVFTGQLAALPPLWHATDAGETLATVAAAYSVTAADLLAANRDQDVGAMFAAPVVVPRFLRVMQRETLSAFAARAGTGAATLLGEYHNGAAPVPAGISLVVAARTFPADASLSLADMAAAAGCAPADIAAANASVAGLLADGLQLTVRGAAVVTSGSTFASLVPRFADAGVTTTAEEIGTASASIAGIFNGSTQGAPVSYTVDRWTVPARTTVDALVAAKFVDLDDFVTRNGAVPGLIEQNTPLRTGQSSETAPGGVSVSAYVERTLAISIPLFAEANSEAGGEGAPAIPALANGVQLMLPALLDPAPLSAVAYAIGSGESLDAVAARFGTDAQTLGASIQDIGGIFVPGQPVTVAPYGTRTTDGEDSLATLRAKFPAGARPTLAELIAAVAPSTTLLRAGAVIVCPAPTVPPGALTLSALATAFGFGADDVPALGRCNAALDGFLDAMKSVTFGGGDPVTVGAHGTLTSLFRRAVPPESGVDFDAFLAAVAGQALLAAGAKVILPPPGVVADAALPAEPAVTTTITELQASVTVTRPAGEVAAGFEAGSSVATRTTPVAALTSGATASYADFAQGVQDAYGGRLRVGVGKRDRAAGPGRARLFVVRFEAPDGDADANAIRRVAVENAPSFFALPPLCRELVSRTASVRLYQSGAADPLPAPAQPLAFRAVDVQVWARAVLSLIDLVLSAPYASAAFPLTRGEDGTSPDFDRLVGAKKTLAQKVSGQLAPVLPAAAGSDAASAQEALRQVLDVSLTTGWDTAAVVQLPTQVDASFAGDGADAGGHRFAGKPLPGSLALAGSSTLGGIAAAYTVDVQAVARVLGGTPNLLKPGVELQAVAGGPVWTVGAHDTLQDGADTLGISLDLLATTFSGTSPLFREGTSVTLNGYSATVAADDSLESMADLLATGVAFLAVANQTLPGLLTGSVWVDGVEHPVTPETATLASMAASLALSVDELAVWIAGQGVLAAGKVLHVAALLPDYALNAGKVQLDRAQGQLNVILQLADPARYRRVLLDLGFPLTGLEYAVQPAPLVDRYETSDWLQFVTALTGEGAGQPAEIDTAIGQLDVPVPLRAYPAPPRLVGQYADPVNPEIAPGTPLAGALAEAKQWRYTATFETQQAAQDLVWLRVGFNFQPRTLLARMAATDDPFAALAEFATNEPAIRPDLGNLLLDPAVLAADEQKRKAAVSAVVALGRIAQRVAGSWGPISPDPAGPTPEDPLVPQLELTFTLETRTRPAADGTPLIDSLVLAREEGTDAWGPGGARPWVGYVNAAGELVLLEPQAFSGHDGELIYSPDPGTPVPAFERRVFAIRYPVLDAVATQNARAALWITRNERLVPGRETNDAFVYRTQATHFADLAVPALVAGTPIAIGGGTVGGLTAAVTALFTELLGDPPTAAATQEKLTVRYGVRLVPPGDGGEGIVVLSPVVFRPLFPYTTDVPAGITSAVQAWAGQNPPAPEVPSFISLEVMVFSGLLPGRQQPLLDLLRLDYELSG